MKTPMKNFDESTPLKVRENSHENVALPKVHQSIGRKFNLEIWENLLESCCKEFKTNFADLFSSFSQI